MSQDVAARIATSSLVAFRFSAGSGVDVCLDGIGTVLAGIPRHWAAKAVKLLNACETEAAQRTELTRIRAACA